MNVPFISTPKIIFGDIRIARRYKKIETFELKDVTYYVVETDYNAAVQMIKDRSTLAKRGHLADAFAEANMKFIISVLDQSDPDAFALMMTDFKFWKELINDEEIKDE